MNPDKDPTYYRLEPGTPLALGDKWWSDGRNIWMDIVKLEVGESVRSVIVYRPHKNRQRDDPKEELIKRLAASAGESKMHLRNLITECEILVKQARNHADPITAVDLEFVLDKFKDRL